MARKIYDIFPPDSGQKKNFSVCDKIESKKRCFSRNPKLKIKNWAIPVLVAILVMVFSGYFFLLRVDIDIWPETEAVTYRGVIEVRTDSLSYDIEAGVITGEIFTVTKEESRTFFSSGKDIEGRKAEGVLRVYNNYSAQPQILVAETRFVSADGKLFRSTERISIPGRTQEGSRIIPGEAEVAIIAAEPGEEYNIEKNSKFSIPGLHGTPMYTSIHAENINPIIGGFIGESPKITERDIETAREILLSSAIEKAQKEMAGSASGFILNPDNMEVTVLKEFVRPEAGERYDSFDYLLEVEVKTLAFKESEIESFLEEILLSRLEKGESINSMFSGMKIWRESLEFNYESDIRKMSDGSILLTMEASALAYPAIREELAKNEFAGMAISNVKMILEDYDKIERVEIHSRPSWLRNITAPGKTRVNIRFDNH